MSEEIKEKLRRLRADLDPVELLKKLRDAQSELARLTSGGSEKPQADPSLESFLAQLPELWQAGECRPTHRQQPGMPADRAVAG